MTLDKSDLTGESNMFGYDPITYKEIYRIYELTYIYQALADEEKKEGYLHDYLKMKLLKTKMELSDLLESSLGTIKYVFSDWIDYHTVHPELVNSRIINRAKRALRQIKKLTKNKEFDNYFIAFHIGLHVAHSTGEMCEHLIDIIPRGYYSMEEFLESFSLGDHIPEWNSKLEKILGRRPEEKEEKEFRIDWKGRFQNPKIARVLT